MSHLVLDRVNELLRKTEKCIKLPQCHKGELYAGIDLGTAYMVLLVVDAQGNPVAGSYRFADVVKDGVVVDFCGAANILRELKREIEGKIGVELVKAAGSFPPDTGSSVERAHYYICEGVGFEVIRMQDEPSAANNVLQIKNGAVVDIGGGTTGIAIIQNGQVVYTADEPTGGTHFSLVTAGAKKLSFEEAEEFKKDPANCKEVMLIVKPVIQKVASIIKNHIKKYQINAVYLAGGTCCLTGIEDIIEKELQIPVLKPENPLFVTPLGIALSCLEVKKDEERGIAAAY